MSQKETVQIFFSSIIICKNQLIKRVSTSLRIRDGGWTLPNIKHNEFRLFTPTNFSLFHRLLLHNIQSTLNLLQFFEIGLRYKPHGGILQFLLPLRTILQKLTDLRPAGIFMISYVSRIISYFLIGMVVFFRGGRALRARSHSAWDEFARVSADGQHFERLTILLSIL